MFPEMRVRFTILSGWSVADRIGEDRLQQVKVLSPHIEALVGDYPREMLAHRLAHDARLAVVDKPVRAGLGASAVVARIAGGGFAGR
jgi:hypothetical protein